MADFMTASEGSTTNAITEIDFAEMKYVPKKLWLGGCYYFSRPAIVVDEESFAPINGPFFGSLRDRNNEESMNTGESIRIMNNGEELMSNDPVFANPVVTEDGDSVPVYASILRISGRDVVFPFGRSVYLITFYPDGLSPYDMTEMAVKDGYDPLKCETFDYKFDNTNGLHYEPKVFLPKDRNNKNKKGVKNWDSYDVAVANEKFPWMFSIYELSKILNSKNYTPRSSSLANQYLITETFDDAVMGRKTGFKKA